MPDKRLQGETKTWSRVVRLKRDGFLNEKPPVLPDYTLVWRKCHRVITRARHRFFVFVHVGRSAVIWPPLNGSGYYGGRRTPAGSQCRLPARLTSKRRRHLPTRRAGIRTKKLDQRRGFVQLMLRLHAALRRISTLGVSAESQEFVFWVSSRIICIYKAQSEGERERGEEGERGRSHRPLRLLCCHWSSPLITVQRNVH